MPAARTADAAQPRAEQLRIGLERVRTRIGAAMEHRPAGAPEPTLIVVTKFHPASDVRLLADLGVRDVGENRDQEAAAKADEVSAAGSAGADLRWHFIGQLQTNKAKSVVGYAQSVHSVDRHALARALSKAMVAEQERTGRKDLDCFVQINLDPAEADAAQLHPVGRGGVRPADVLELAALIHGSPGLRLAGVMAVAPLGGYADAAFARLAVVSAELAADFPEATGISAGMSGDLEQAIAHGATHLRVGSDVLGARPALR
jgi:hypothetical protein